MRSELEPGAARALEAACRSLGVTPATAVRTAWGIAADFVAGTTGNLFAVPVTLRNPELEDVGKICGMLTETTLVRVDTLPGKDSAWAAREHQRQWAESLEHQHLGISGIERALDAPRELAWSLVGFDASPSSQTHRLESGLQAMVAVTADGTHYPVNLHVTAGERWTVELESDPGKVPEHSAAALLRAFGRALESITGPAVPLARLELVDTQQVRGFETSGTPRMENVDLLPELFAERVRLTPGATAVVFAGIRHSFADLAARVTQATVRLRALLRDPGTGGHPILALRLPRGVDAVVAILAALESGIALMPLDPAWPQERVKAAMGLSRAALLWNGEGLQATGLEAPSCRIPAAPEARDTASIIFTSGSTGEPKAVVVSHRAMAHLYARHCKELYPVGETLAVAHTSAFHFDAHWDAFMSLFAGHELHLLTEDQYLDPFTLAAYVREEGIGYLDFTPTLWNALLVDGGLGTLPRICVAGGEPFPAALWDRMATMAAGSGSRVLNLYGTTEPTVDAMA
ncbi:MAG: AMP-binding protein, partial [Micrococcaceae bacterium]|nr:AMP-binding protein [Micrococcaceae bacterium]